MTNKAEAYALVKATSDADDYMALLQATWEMVGIPSLGATAKEVHDRDVWAYDQAGEGHKVIRITVEVVEDDFDGK